MLGSLLGAVPHVLGVAGQGVPAALRVLRALAWGGASADEQSQRSDGFWTRVQQ